MSEIADSTFWFVGFPVACDLFWRLVGRYKLVDFSSRRTDLLEVMSFRLPPRQQRAGTAGVPWQARQLPGAHGLIV